MMYAATPGHSYFYNITIFPSSLVSWLVWFLALTLLQGENCTGDFFYFFAVRDARIFYKFSLAGAARCSLCSFLLLFASIAGLFLRKGKRKLLTQTQMQERKSRQSYCESTTQSIKAFCKAYFYLTFIFAQFIYGCKFYVFF